MLMSKKESLALGKEPFLQVSQSKTIEYDVQPGGFLNKIFRTQPINSKSGASSYGSESNEQKMQIEKNSEQCNSLQVENTNQEVDFLKSLSCYHLIMFGIGNTIGAGIFALSGIAAQYAGPSLCISFLISGVLAMLTALSFCELSSRIPHSSGSSYSYVYSIYGEFPASIIGWNLHLRFGICATALARAWASYFVGLFKLFGYDISILNELNFFGMSGSILSALFIIICTYIANKGSSHSNTFNLIFTYAKLFSLIFIITVAFYFFQPSNLKPFVLPDKGGFMGTMQGAMLLFFSYLGFDMITTLAQETKNAKRDQPLSIWVSLLLCIIIYFFTAFSVSGMAQLHTFQPEIAMPLAFEYVGAPWMSIIIYFCAFFGLTAACFTCLMGYTRILYVLAQDGLMFKTFGKMNPKKNLPTQGAWISCSFLCIAAFIVRLEELTIMVSLGNLISYAIVNAALTSFRYRNPNAATNDALTYQEKLPAVFLLLAFFLAFSIANFNTIITYILLTVNLGIIVILVFSNQPNRPKDTFAYPLVPFLPCLGIFLNFYLISSIQASIWFYFIIFELIGIAFYFCYGYFHSKLNGQMVDGSSSIYIRKGEQINGTNQSVFST